MILNFVSQGQRGQIFCFRATFSSPINRRNLQSHFTFFWRMESGELIIFFLAFLIHCLKLHDNLTYEGGENFFRKNLMMYSGKHDTTVMMHVFHMKSVVRMNSGSENKKINTKKELMMKQKKIYPWWFYRRSPWGWSRFRGRSCGKCKQEGFLKYPFSDFEISGSCLRHVRI